MLIRLVRMTFRPVAREDFLALFDEAAPKIRGFAGCRHLELWQGARYAHILTTHSHWVDEEALERYRHSDLFETTWAEARTHFAAPPAAHSYHVARPVDEIRNAPRKA